MASYSNETTTCSDGVDAQQILQQSQQSVAENKKALVGTKKALKDKREKNSSQRKMVCKLRADLDDSEQTVRGLRGVKAILEMQNAELKNELHGLRNLQMIKEEMHAIRMLMGVISVQLTNSFRTRSRMRSRSSSRASSSKTYFLTICE